MKTKVYVSCDHAAIDLKDELCAHINEKDGYEAVDLGIKHGEKIDYPVAAKRVADAVLSNKVKGIRAAAVSEPYSAKLTRMHNDANVLCMGARVVGPELAKMILDEYLDAEFEGGRHAGRVELISKIENGRL